MMALKGKQVTEVLP